MYCTHIIKIISSGSCIVTKRTFPSYKNPYKEIIKSRTITYHSGLYYLCCGFSSFKVPGLSLD